MFIFLLFKEENTVQKIYWFSMHFLYFIRQKRRKDLPENDNQDNHKKKWLYKSKPGKHKRALSMLGLWLDKPSIEKSVITNNKQQKMLLSSQKQTLGPRNVILLINGVKLAISITERLSPPTWRNIWLQMKITDHNYFN